MSALTITNDAVRAFLESISGSTQVVIPGGKTYWVWPQEAVDDIGDIINNPEFKSRVLESVQRVRAGKSKFRRLNPDRLPD